MASKRFEGQAETEQEPYADDYFFYRYDIRGSVTNIMDGAGSVVKSYDYDEFGVTTASGDTFFNEVTFTGSVAEILVCWFMGRVCMLCKKCASNAKIAI